MQNRNRIAIVLVGGVAAVGLTTAAAVAHGAKFEPTCGVIHLEGSNYNTSKGVNHWSMTMDAGKASQIVYSGTFATSFVKDVTPPQSGETHTWSAKVTASDDPNNQQGYSPTYPAVNVGPCGTPPPTPKDASASLSKTPATCDTGETLAYGAIVNATWSGTPDKTVGPAAYDTFANAIPNHLFGDGTPKQEYKGELAGPNTSLCAPPPPPPTCEELGTCPPPPPCTACNLPILPVKTPGVQNCSGTLAGGVWDGIEARTHRSCYLVNDHLNKMGFTNDAGAINLLLSNTDSAGPVTFYRWTGTATVSGNGNGQGCYEDPNEYSLSFLEGNDGLACHVSLCTGLTFAGNHGQLGAKYVTSLHGALRIFNNVKYDGRSTHKRAGAIRIKHSTFPKFKHGHNHGRQIIFTDVTIGAKHYAHKVWH